MLSSLHPKVAESNAWKSQLVQFDIFVISKSYPGHFHLASLFRRFQQLSPVLFDLVLEVAQVDDRANLCQGCLALAIDKGPGNALQLGWQKKMRRKQTVPPKWNKAIVGKRKMPSEDWVRGMNLDFANGNILLRTKERVLHDASRSCQIHVQIPFCLNFPNPPGAISWVRKGKSSIKGASDEIVPWNWTRLKLQHSPVLVFSMGNCAGKGEPNQRMVENTSCSCFCFCFPAFWNRPWQSARYCFLTLTDTSSFCSTSKKKVYEFSLPWCQDGAPTNQWYPNSLFSGWYLPCVELELGCKVPLVGPGKGRVQRQHPNVRSNPAKCVKYCMLLQSRSGMQAFHNNAVNMDSHFVLSKSYWFTKRTENPPWEVLIKAPSKGNVVLQAETSQPRSLKMRSEIITSGFNHESFGAVSPMGVAILCRISCNPIYNGLL